MSNDTHTNSQIMRISKPKIMTKIAKKPMDKIVQNDIQKVIKKMVLEKSHLQQKINTINQSIKLIKITFKM